MNTDVVCLNEPLRYGCKNCILFLNVLYFCHIILIANGGKQFCLIVLFLFKQTIKLILLSLVIFR